VTETMKNRVMIFGPKVADGTYVVELRTAEGEALAISIPQQLCSFVFGVAAASRNTRFQGGPLRLYRDLHRLIAPSVAWRLPSFDTSSAAHEQCRWHVEAEHFRRGRLITSSNFVGNSSNTLPSFVPFSLST
jgi:hypothetical protein